MTRSDARRTQQRPQAVVARTCQLGRVWPWFLGVIVILFAAALLALPIFIEKTAENWVRENTSNELEIDDLDFNPFTGRIVVKYADASSNIDHSKLLEVGIGDTWIDWLPLFKKRVHLGKLSLKNARVDIRYDENGQTTIAGFELPTASADETIPEAAVWQLGFGPLEFENVELVIDSPVAKQTWIVRKLYVGALATWDTDAGADIDLQIDGAHGTGRITGELYPFSNPLRLTGKIKLDNMLLQGMPDTIALLGIINPTGVVNLDGDIELTRGDHADDVKSLISGVITLNDLEFLRPQLRQRFRYERGKFAGDLSLDYQTGMQAKVDIDGDNFAIIDDELDLELIQIEKISVNSARYNGINDIAAQRIHATNLNLLERDSEGQDRKNHDLSIAELDIKPLALSLERMVVGDLDMQGIQGYFTVVANADPNADKNAAEPGGESETDEAQSAAQDEASFFETFSIDAGHIRIHNSSQFTLVDTTVDPPMQIVLDDLELDLGGLATRKTDQASDLRISGKIGKYSSVNINGSIHPGQGIPEGSIAGEIRSLDLSPFAGYVRSFLGYQLVSGSLDADFVAEIANKQLTASADVTANRLRMKELPANEKPPADDSSNIPIGTALSLLRDKNDDIKLNIPIEGEFDNLTIGLGDALGQAVGSATKKSLETTVMVLYAPLGIAKLAGKIAGATSHLRFQPIEFEPGDATLDDNDTAYLQDVIALLGKKDDIRLSLCGFATQADYLANDSIDSGSATTVARDRGEVVKDYLVDPGGIAEERLFVCSPEVDVTQDARPRVELTI